MVAWKVFPVDIHAIATKELGKTECKSRIGAVDVRLQGMEVKLCAQNTGVRNRLGNESLRFGKNG